MTLRELSYFIIITILFGIVIVQARSLSDYKLCNALNNTYQATQDCYHNE